MPKFDWVKKVLVLGSGAIKIGQAGEFDYSGSQCLKAIREEGIDTVLINPNIATIQTDPRLAGTVYLLPVTIEFVEEVIKKEKPDSIMLAFGGQTALNVGVELEKKGILKKYGVKVLGTPVRAIEETEDRELFRQAMFRSKIEVAKSKIATSLSEAINIAKDEVGYPIIVRVAYTLGGKGSGIAHNEEELKQIVGTGLAQSMIHQVLIEEYLEKPYWKEIEYEVVRDYDDNCITVCNMENFDPMGIHTGDSVVIAPSQTLTDKEYHELRGASIRVIRELGIVGECNIQYALYGNTMEKLEFRAIEVNARLSRSSALASKATGYPLAYIAAKLALGYTLPELMNQVTNITTACFEPALDYLVIKIPRWDLQKFTGKVSRRIGTQMKSVGEVMAIGRNFEEVFQKAIRMLEIGKLGVVCNPESGYSLEELKDIMENPTDQRFLLIPDAMRAGLTIDEIFQLSGIDKWFLYKIKNILDIEDQLKNLNLISDSKILSKTIKKAKKYGFSDLQIAICLNTDEITIRRLRNKNNIIPVIKQIDTLAAEWPAQTNYLYATYGGDKDDLEFTSQQDLGKIIVLGSGTYRIGSSVEFDWGTVNLAWSFKEFGMKEVILINYNPETVSTDYDMSDKLYFEEITFERVIDIYEKEMPRGVVVSVGGQVSNNLAPRLVALKDYFRTGKVNVIGTEGRDIDRAEDRSKFSRLLDELGIKQPKWSQLITKEDAFKFAVEVGYPVLVRPSYVLSGAAMRVAYSEEQLKEYLTLAAEVSQEFPVVISKYIEDAREVDVDGVCDGEDVFIGGVMEHVENAGVHSGDATMTIPPVTIPITINNKIRKNTKKIALALKIKGPFNIQYLVKEDEVFVIECNLRSSRSMPFVSKTKGVNLMTLAASVMMGKSLHEITGYHSKPDSGIDYWGVKVPMFSFMRLHGADPVLGVEMASTGEAACYGESFYEALVKGLISTDLTVPIDKGNMLITVGGLELKQKILPLVQKLSKFDFNIYATDHTAEAFQKYDIPVTVLYKLSELDKKPNIRDYITENKIDLIINIPTTKNVEKYLKVINDEYDIRRMAIEFNIPVMTNFQLAQSLVDAIGRMKVKKHSIISLNEYLKRLDWTFGFEIDN
ncbi:MAG: carbamoyl-phosphate synthase (glutamine-hydrolyzing) large subunit [Candidatus Lokiarchaeota archaeon]|nr:carbamoyl-phosphate synthase (glutamine-hydrolyzing) large subunit [Candidatus Lokiarchaeota archaeon]